MTPIGNTEAGYGAIAIALHWGMAALLIGLAVLGLYMVALPDVGFDTRKIVLILYHKELGMLALALFAVRLAWRVTNILPHLVEELPDWQKVIARFVHLCFYALMFALPMTGWLMSSAAGFPVSFLQLFTFPDLIGPNDYLFKRLIDIHKWLSYALLVLLVVHAAAALRHRFAYRDGASRMLP
ncbi:MAG TPA: cytochrome b [Burkholderiales bacterium]